MSSITKSTARFSKTVTSILLPLAIVLGLTLLHAAPARAQGDNAKQKATEYYKQGTTQFKLGNFDKAIELFKLAYETSPHHAFLFNLGQAYRQKGDCQQAIFFYKGYLSEAGDQAKNRSVVEAHIKELAEICEATEDSKNKPPDGALAPADNGKAGDGSGDGSGDSDTDEDRVADAGSPGDDVSTSGATSGTASAGGSVTDTLTPWQPSLLSATMTAGPALLQFGDALEFGGTQPTITISAGYPLSFGKIGLTIGALFTYTPVPWELDGMTGTSTLASALINVGVRYWATDKIGVGMDVGGGGLFLTGLDTGNIFLPPGEMATGALGMPNVRAGLAADYLLTNNLVISAMPLVFSMSPAKDGLRQEVESFTRIEFMVGMGYRM